MVSDEAQALAEARFAQPFCESKMQGCFGFLLPLTDTD
jgi:hypothetical protein